MTDASRGRGHRRYRLLWRRVLRQQPLCATGCGRAAVEVDHIVPLHRGGSLFDRANLQGLCRRCHRLKTAAERRRVRGAMLDGTPLGRSQ